MRKRYMAICLLLLLPYRTFAFGFPVVRVTVEVVDELGEPISGARVNILFFGDERKVGLTDANGRFTGQNRSHGHIGIGVTKDGYYGGGAGGNLDEPRGVVIRRRWPDVTRRVVLRRIKDPVPMYAIRKDWRMDPGTEVGFDLLKAAMVAPHGKGETVDMLVRIDLLEPQEGQEGASTIAIRFPNPGDGMRRMDPTILVKNSIFSGPYHAPEDGYLSEWEEARGPLLGAGRSRLPGHPTTVMPEGPFLHETPFYLRIRSEKDNTGTVTNAMYGKIMARGGRKSDGRYGIHWAPPYTTRKYASIVLPYYVNPDGTTNLEFDPERNLLRGIIRPQDDRLLIRVP